MNNIKNAITLWDFNDFQMNDPSEGNNAGSSVKSLPAKLLASKGRILTSKRKYNSLPFLPKKVSIKKSKASSKAGSKSSVKASVKSVKKKPVAVTGRISVYTGPLMVRKLNIAEKKQLLSSGFRRYAAKQSPINDVDFNLILRNLGFPGYSQNKMEYDKIIDFVNIGKNLPLRERALRSVKKDSKSMKSKVLVGAFKVQNAIQGMKLKTNLNK
jgi:hypothetical protein